jgi:AbrB family looped-hinge helix DNA binding protein
MLCKVTAKNQLTLPKELVDRLGIGEYLEARIEDGCIVLEPVLVRPLVNRRLEAIRRRVETGGTAEADLSGIIDGIRHAGRL